MTTDSMLQYEAALNAITMLLNMLSSNTEAACQAEDTYCPLQELDEYGNACITVQDYQPVPLLGHPCVSNEARTGTSMACTGQQL